MTPDEQEMEAAHFELWEGELPIPTWTLEEAQKLYPDMESLFVIEALPREPGFFRQLRAWLMLILVVSLPWAAGFLLVVTIIKAFQ